MLLLGPVQSHHTTGSWGMEKFRLFPRSLRYALIRVVRKARRAQTLFVLRIALSTSSCLEHRGVMVHDPAVKPIHRLVGRFHTHLRASKLRPKQAPVSTRPLLTGSQRTLLMWQ